MADESAGSAKRDASEKAELNRILVRPWPKMVMLYPMMLISILFGIINLRNSGPADGGTLLALVWIFIFGANLFVMAFEFNRLKSMVIFFVILAFVFGSLFVAERYEISVLSWISGMIGALKPWANSRFYFLIAGLLAFMFVFMFLHTRMDYWEITHNELLHHHGLMGNVERFPAPNLRFNKEINDVVEFTLFFSGTLIMFPQSESRTITLENVPMINRVERDLKHLLSRLAVDIDPG